MGIFSRSNRGDAGAENKADAAVHETVEAPAGAKPEEQVDFGAAEDAAAMTAPAEADEGSGQLTGDSKGLHFYKQPEALSPKRHGSLGVLRDKRSFKFAEGHHLVPLTLREMANAALHYPIIFAGEKKLPCAVMGLRRGKNLFIAEDGSVDSALYMPAYVRQYPFLLARVKQADKSVLFIDRASDYLIENGGEPLFEGDQPSQFTKGALTFLTNLQSQWRETEAFATDLQKLELFETKELKLVQREASGKAGETKPIVKYFSIDFAKIKELAPEQLKHLAAKDYFQAIYAHQVSLFNWSKIISLTFQQQQQRAAA